MKSATTSFPPFLTNCFFAAMALRGEKTLFKGIEFWEKNKNKCGKITKDVFYCPKLNEAPVREPLNHKNIFVFETHSEFPFPKNCFQRYQN